MEKEQRKCPDCGSLNAHTNGQTRLRKKDNKHTKQLYCPDCGKYNTIVVSEVDVELITENVKYKKQTQKFQDTNRIERKAFRENARIENAVEEYAREISQTLKLMLKS